MVTNADEIKPENSDGSVNNDDTEVAALILSAGRGHRLGGENPVYFVERQGESQRPR